MTRTPLAITPIPAFSDNYIWLLQTGSRRCAVVDPGDGDAVIRHLREHDLRLDTILITHHHADHIGGIPGLVRHYSARVIGPDDSRIPGRDETVAEGDTAVLEAMGLSFEVLEVPGHTRSHIAYYGHGCLFPGDTLFSAGCGRLFEGTPGQMQASLDKLSALPGDTAIYCAHEYTRSNCAFARAVEPGNADLLAYSEWVEERRATGRPTLPGSLEQERACNPFLRTREPGVIESARKIDPSARPGTSTMAIIRAWKDHFQA